MSGAPLLEVEDLTVRFGGVVALDSVSFSARAGQLLGLIGPNGAGKTTVFNCVSRLVTPVAGSVRVDGVDLLARRAHAIAGLGVARTFQHVGLLPDLTVRDNVKLGTPSQRRAGIVAALHWRRADEQALGALVDDLLERLGIADVADAPAGELPLGMLKRVELARALAGSPRVVLLDEPANGLSHQEVAELGDFLLRWRGRSDALMLLVEHHMGLVTRVADVAVVLDFGRVVAAGPPAEVCKDPVVVEAYLGSAA